jgi:3-oxoacyl-[acyl-carrier protein] reductase
VHVVIGYASREADAKETANTVEEQGGTASVLGIDVADEASVQAAFRAIRAEYGRLDVLVSNAGITRDGFLTMMSADKFDTVVDVNLRGTFLCCREAMKVMAYARSGSIVTISSAPGARGVPGQTNYSASKGGVVSFTKALAQEAARHNVRANVVAPGFIETDMTRAMRPDIRKSYAAQIPMGRVGGAEEVAAAVTFLASTRASYVTGACLVVDGGLVP